MVTVSNRRIDSADDDVQRVSSTPGGFDFLGFPGIRRAAGLIINHRVESGPFVCQEYIRSIDCGYRLGAHIFCPNINLGASSIGRHCYDLYTRPHPIRGFTLGRSYRLATAADRRENCGYDQNGRGDRRYHE